MSENDLQRPEFVEPEQERPVVIRHSGGRLHCEYQPNVNFDHFYSFFQSSEAAHLHIEIDGVTHKVGIGLEELRTLYEECGRRIVEIEAVQKAVAEYRTEYKQYKDWLDKAKAKEQNGK